MLVVVVIAPGHHPSTKWLARNGIGVRKDIYLLDIPRTDIALISGEGVTAYFANKDAPFGVGCIGEPGLLTRLSGLI